MRTLLLLLGDNLQEQINFVSQYGLYSYWLTIDSLQKLHVSDYMTLNENRYNGGIASRSHNGLLEEVQTQFMDILDKRMNFGDFTILNVNGLPLSKIQELAAVHHYHVYYHFITNDAGSVVGAERNIDINDKLGFGTPLKQLDDILPKIHILDHFHEVKVIGDIHGSYSALKKLFGSELLLKHECFYIFLGDYLNRGIQNKEVFDFINRIKDEPNVCLLEGNHELHLKQFANNQTIHHKGFICRTLPELLGVSAIAEKQQHLHKEELLDMVLSQADKQQIQKLRHQCKQLYQSLKPMFMFQFRGQNYLCNHGGIPYLPSSGIVAARHLIHGVGAHTDGDLLAQQYHQNILENKSLNFIQVFGHRYAKDNPHVFNLLDKEIHHIDGMNIMGVEFGGSLCTLELDEHGVQTKKYRNDVFDLNLAKERMGKVKFSDHIMTANADLNELLSDKNNVRVHFQRFEETSDSPNQKCHTNLMSVFYTGSKYTPLAKIRGLFVDRVSGQVHLRGYPEILNFNKAQNTIVKQTQLPINVYERNGGFLGLMSTVNDEVVLATKLSTNGTYKGLIQELWDKEHPDVQYVMKEMAKHHNCTFALEVIHNKNQNILDNAGIEQLIVLDALPNDVSIVNVNDFSQRVLDELFGLLHDLNLPLKHIKRVRRVAKCFSFKEVRQVKKALQSLQDVEGFVFSDNQGMMFKCFSSYYSSWRSCQLLVEQFVENQNERFSLHKCKNQMELNFMTWLLAQDHQTLKQFGLHKQRGSATWRISTLRDAYFKANNSLP